MAEDKDQGGGELVCMQWLAQRVIGIMRMKEDLWDQMIRDEAKLTVVGSFLHEPTVKRLVISSYNGSLDATQCFPQHFAHAVYFVKKGPSKLMPQSIGLDVVYGDMGSDTLPQLSAVLDRLYLPLLSNRDKTLTYPDGQLNDVMHHFHKFAGQTAVAHGVTQGKVFLPIEQTEAAAHCGPSRAPTHVYESAMAEWISQVTASLSQSTALASCVQPAALSWSAAMREICFWKARVSSLQLVAAQLTSPGFQQILSSLQNAQSSYQESALRLVSQVTEAVTDAQDCSKHLEFLRHVLEPTLTPHDCFMELAADLDQIVASVTLVWSFSNHYGAPKRISRIWSALCSDIVTQAVIHIGPYTIFDLESEESLPKLTEAGSACKQLKRLFLQCKSRVRMRHKNDRNWRIESSAIFGSIDLFLNRCFDVAQIIETRLAFASVGDIRIGGTRGLALTQQLSDVHSAYTTIQSELAPVQSLAFDLANPAFEREFFKFREHVKLLEHQLGSILNMGFEDSLDVVHSAVKLLESFGDLVRRPLVMECIELRPLVQRQAHELTHVESIFKQQCDKPELTPNMPPVAGAISWGRMLKQRIERPMQILATLPSKVVQSSEYAAMNSQYEKLVDELEAWEDKQHACWVSAIDVQVLAKLREPLLLKQDANLCVNFDPALVAMLRECKYLLLLGVEIPESAMQVYQQWPMFQLYMSKLDAVVNMCNHMADKLLPVEKPLLEKRLSELDLRVDKGLSLLNWKSHGVGDYIGQLFSVASNLYETVMSIKGHISSICAMLKDLSTTKIFARTEGKSIDVKEVNVRVNALLENCQNLNPQIHQMCDDTRDLFGIAKGTPGWRGYVDYMSQQVISGLVAVVMCPLQDILSELRQESTHFFEVRLELSKHLEEGIIFVPSLGDKDPAGVRHIFSGWLESICQVGTRIQRLECDGDYMPELRENFAILSKIAGIEKGILAITKQALTLKDDYQSFSFLWQEDCTQHIDHFIDTNSDKKLLQKLDDAGIVLPSVLSGTGPSLEHFEDEIANFHDLHEDVANHPTGRSVRWMHLDLRTLKHHIGSQVHKWRAAFTRELTDQVTGSIDQMLQFISASTQVLSKAEKLCLPDQPDAEPDNEPDDAQFNLHSAMQCLQDVNARAELFADVTTPLEAAILLLRRCNVDMSDDVVVGLESAPKHWESLRRQAAVITQNLKPITERAELAILRTEEDCKRKISRFVHSFSSKAPFKWEPAGAEAAYEMLNVVALELRDLRLDAERVVVEQQLFGLKELSLDPMSRCQTELKPLKHLWDIAAIALTQMQYWRRTILAELDIDTINTVARGFSKQVAALNGVDPSWPVVTELTQSLTKFVNSLPMVEQLRSSSLRTRHWKALMRTTKKQFVMTENCTLGDLLTLDLHEFGTEVRNIVDQAAKEVQIEAFLQNLQQTWEQSNFEFAEYKGVTQLRPTDGIRETLEESQVSVQALSASRYASFFQEDLIMWMSRFALIDSVISSWSDVQRSWSSLQTIFSSSKDIRSQLPKETKRFDGVDAEWRELMGSAHEAPAVLEACTGNLLSALDKMKLSLDVCQLALADYVEIKRKKFPRFYFVSYMDILDILSHGNNPGAVMAHLLKLFDNVKYLMFSIKDDSIEPPTPELVLEEFKSLSAAEIEQKYSENAIGMFSKEGEFVDFGSQICECVGVVEVWLLRLVHTMQSVVNKVVQNAILSYSEVAGARCRWQSEHASQPVLVANQVHFCNQVVAAFEGLEQSDENAMTELLKKNLAQLEDLISLVGNNTGSSTKLMALITYDVHSRDVVQQLISQQCTSVDAFTWLGQLRTSWCDQAENTVINVADASFVYANEYLGNTSRLVITPLTDKCYITLTQALRLNMGGAPAGPAGTGKTETTKELARTLGKMVYVFNCSDQMDYKSLGSIFKGLSISGAWGCFDEFNRIEVQVLSVVSTQFMSIVSAIGAGRKRFMFMGEDILLDSSCGVFITMNPGYAGRSELPESLRALFRPVTMVVPDLELICENMLLAQGFFSAKDLASKFTHLYKLAAQLLTNTGHYDWGLRAIKSLLVVAGNLKKYSDRPEGTILIQALLDFNMPKLIAADVPAFTSLMKVLFVNSEWPTTPGESELEKHLKEVACESKLHPEKVFILKALQLDGVLAVRHSAFVVGPSGSGKTAIWKTLAQANQKRGLKGLVRILNPKSISTDSLYGYVHPSSREWCDGLLSKFMREFSEMGSMDPKWLVLDGEIDPLWIESLNTVMDDNKVLTLPSNERILLTPPMRLLFEISQLKHATPATVSRAGVLNVGHKDVGWMPFTSSWTDVLEHRRVRSIFSVLFNHYAPAVLEYADKLTTVIRISEIAMMEACCHLLDALLLYYKARLKGGASEKITYERIFIFALMWGVCGLIPSEHHGRVRFSVWWRQTFKQVEIPESDTIFDYCLNNEASGFVPWKETIPTNPFIEVKEMHSLLLPCVETMQTSFFVTQMMHSKHPLMVVGLAGTGKSVMVNHNIALLPPEYTSIIIKMNHFTTSDQFQALLEQSVEKKAGRRFAPIGSKQLIYLIDDLNMPSQDLYNTQPALELLLQHISCGYWYDRKKLQEIHVEQTQYVSCMNPSVGTSSINPRLQRRFFGILVESLSDESLQSIYTSILKTHFKDGFHKAVYELAPKMVKATLDFHLRVCNQFTPTLAKAHYRFSLHDISKVFSGILLSEPLLFRSPLKIARLWLHEATRVYCDRMVTQEDHMQITKELNAVATNHLSGDDVDALLSAPLIYTAFTATFLTKATSYNDVADFERLREVLGNAIRLNNAPGSPNAAMDLVLFREFAEHAVRVMRVLVTQRGAMLLIGVGGSGKQSLCRLAALVSKAKLEVPSVPTALESPVDTFMEDLRTLYKQAGIHGTLTLLMLTEESMMRDERLLLYVNDFLSGGNIMSLMTTEDIESIQKALAPQLRDMGQVVSVSDVNKLFLDRLYANLHVVLCFSPVGSTLRIQCRRFSSLVSATTINWVHPWPESGLQYVAESFLQDLPLRGHSDPEAILGNLVSFMAHAHTSAIQVASTYSKEEGRLVYSPPKAFLALITLFKNQLAIKAREIDSDMARLDKGLLRLGEATEAVSVLREGLKSQKEVVAQKMGASDALLEQLAIETDAVEAEKQLAADERKRCSLLAKEVDDHRQVCFTDLSKAEPALYAAEQSLQSLDKNSLVELKTLAKPPKMVVSVLAAVMILLSATKPSVAKDLSWDAAKRSMKDVNKFQSTLLGFKSVIEGDGIPEPVLKALQPYLDDGMNFNPEAIASKSKAAAGISSWVINIAMYNRIYREVQPKRVALDQANEYLKEAQSSLEDANNRVFKLEAKLQLLQQKFEDAVTAKNDAVAQQDKMQNQLDLADRLINGLASELVRWKSDVEHLVVLGCSLMADVALACAFVSYAGPFSTAYRNILINEHWIPFFKEHELPLSVTSNPAHYLVNDICINTWKNEGLPNDNFSIENAIIFEHCERWPVLIDPQLQANRWFKQHEHGCELHVIKIQDVSKNLFVMERAVMTGQVVLIEDMNDEIPSCLTAVLSRSITSSATGELQLQLIDKFVPYDASFRLVFHTVVSNPHLKPEVQAQTTLINFSVTLTALAEQLVSVVMAQERPDLEELHKKLIRENNECQVRIKELEDNLLQLLSSATGDLLENTDLVESLESTKATALVIEKKLADTAKTHEDINVTRNLYLPAAHRGSLLFFEIERLQSLSSIYCYSLNTFMRIFQNSIGTIGAWKKDSEIQLDVHVSKLVDSITTSIFDFLRMGIFVKHQLVFGAQICFAILLDTRQIDLKELNTFLSAKRDVVGANPHRDWLPDAAWGSVEELAVQIDVFKGLSTDIDDGPARWKEWFHSACPEVTRLPAQWKDVQPFQKLLLVRSLRPDRLLPAIRIFITTVLGERYVNNEPISLEKVYEQLSPCRPLLFLLSRGVNPMNEIASFGSTFGVEESNGRLVYVSLGQGQEDAACNAIDQASKNGDWVVLQNIHLMKRWLPVLAAKLHALIDGNPHQATRIFLTAEAPSSAESKTDIPLSVLQNSVKLTSEPSTDPRTSLLRSVNSIAPELFNSTSRPEEFRSVLFGLCLFHTLIIGRGRFGKPGWSRTYAFSNGDVQAAINVVSAYLENSTNDVPWPDLRYLVGEIVYGGHVVDAWDQRIVQAQLSRILKAAPKNDDHFLAPGLFMPALAESDHMFLVSHVESLCIEDGPELFGLPLTAERALLTHESATMLSQLGNLISLPGVASSGGSNPQQDDILETVLGTFASRCPGLVDVVPLHEQLQKEYDVYGLVLAHEMVLFNCLVTEVTSSLAKLNGALNGECVMTESLDSMRVALSANRVPEGWKLLSFASEKGVGAWTNQLIVVHAQLLKWSEDVGVPKFIGLGMLFRPKSFLAAVSHASAGKLKVAMDTLELSTTVTRKSIDDVSAAPRDGAYLSGMYLEGTTFDPSQGVLNSPSAVIPGTSMHPSLALVHVRAIPIGSISNKTHDYTCPVYSTTCRDNTFVFSATLKILERDATEWILAGVAILLNVEDAL